jgi:hypothetical protein
MRASIRAALGTGYTDSIPSPVCATAATSSARAAEHYHLLVATLRELIEYLHVSSMRAGRLPVNRHLARK